ncbi:MAG: SDR family NAD(P)-dependent oxidoreductase [Arenicella sp.]
MDYNVVYISGASSGIGQAVAEYLAGKGLKLVLIARRADKLEALKNSFDAPEKCHTLSCDITNTQEVLGALHNVPEEFKECDVLVNCAGAALGMGTGQEADWHDWQAMIDLNCKGLAFLTHYVLPKMVERDLGHIVNIGSIAGTYPYRGGNIYGATKAFVEQLSLNLKSDLLGTSIRVTNIEPGMVSDTEFSLVRFSGDQEKVRNVYEGLNALTAKDIASAVAWVIEQPPHVNVNRIEIMPVSQAPARTEYYKK